MSEEGPYVLQVGDYKTLQLYCMSGRLVEELKPFSKTRMTVEYVDPNYSPSQYAPTPEILSKLGADPAFAVELCKNWMTHTSQFMYYVQFKDDVDGTLTKALHGHTESLSIICDSRLKLDPTPLWNTFDGLFSFAIVHQEYRQDPDRDAKWEMYSKRLKDVHDRISNDLHAGQRLVLRMVRQVELHSGDWKSLPAIHTPKPADGPTAVLDLFYSYSHKDEPLRDQLQAHLALLRRRGVIREWHDRCISSGTEWKGQIDEHLNRANLILLLISSDFLASDYCYDVEMTKAIERHESGEARVIPVILRPCDWQHGPFAELQALPKDGKAITTWGNVDEGFADVARSIRAAAGEILASG